jgi:hypothetical protein
MICKPYYIELLDQFERDRQAEILRTLELHIADQRFGQAHRTLAAYELEVQERQLPLESLGIAPHHAAALIRAGIETATQLRDCSDSVLDELRGVTLEAVAKLKSIRQRLLER